jgi:hypothetical protein
MHADEEIAGVLRIKSAIAAGRMLLAGWRLQYALKRNPSWHLQPRVPAGSRDGGWWTDVNGSNTNVAGAVISVCVPSGISRYTDEYGIRRWAAYYDCPGGQTIRREGIGNAPGVIRDLFQ